MTENVGDMATQAPSDEIFPQHSGKTYALAEWMDGESPQVGKGPEDTVFSFPVLLLLEILLLLGVTFAIFAFSLIKQAPLEAIANPLVTTDPAKAPWYFVGLQELLEHMHPLVAGVIIPGLLVLFLVVLPYIDVSPRGAGVWFSSPRGRRVVGWTAVYTLMVMSAYIALDNAFSLRELLRHRAPLWVAQGLVPGAILAVLVILPVLVLWRLRVDRREMMMALFTVMFISAIVFTASGFLFRGPGFKMHLPWQMPNGYNPWDGL